MINDYWGFLWTVGLLTLVAGIVVGWLLAG